MKNWRNFALKIGMTLASLALIVTSMNANLTCMYVAHQSELPKGAKKLRKF